MQYVRDLFQHNMEGSDFWVPIDNWRPLEHEKILRTTKNSITMPVSEFFGMDSSRCLDNFIMTPKRCYNADIIRDHICQYVNYFERFYDPDRELMFYYFKIKASIDLGIDENGYRRAYTLEDLSRDIQKYILSESMYDKIYTLIRDNYILNLEYRNKTNEALQYTNRHGEYLMEISIFQNILIPILMHFIYKNKILNTKSMDTIILTTFNWLFEVYKNPYIMQKRGLTCADVMNKLYETVNTTMERSYKHNKPLWDMSEIRGMNIEVNSHDAINIVIMQMMPKYNFNKNIITFNISGIRNNIKYNVTEISYEYDFCHISSSKRDGEDNTSQLDKFEAHTAKIDEGLVIHNNFRAQKVMQIIRSKFGPFDHEELMYYKRELTKANHPLINTFQQNIISNLFYKYFGDTVSIKSINADDYLTLMVAAKSILNSNNMKILSYIIAGNFQKIAQRTSLCKKEMIKLESSPYYMDVCRKYNNNEKIIKSIISFIATILSSTIYIIDYYDKELDGELIITESDILIDEVLMFISLI